MQRVHRLSRREIKTILHYVGDACLLLAVAMLIPIIVAFIYNEPRYVVPFISSALISGIFGVIFVFCTVLKFILNYRKSLQIMTE